MDGIENHRGTTPFVLDVGYRVVLPRGPAPAARVPLLVGLHGFGDDGERLLDRLHGLFPAPFAALFPDGPYPVEMRNEDPPRVGRAWYQYTGDQAAFVAAMDVAGAHLEGVIDAVGVRHPIDRSRVVLLGYSQGGYLAGYHALKHVSRFAGLVSIACRVKVEAIEESIDLTDVPILIVHGRRDRAVRLEPQEASVAELRRRGAEVTLEIHEGGHGLRSELSAPIRRFLARVFRT